MSSEAIMGLVALASSVAAVLAWAAKLWWGKEHIAAKNETIHAKDAEIEVLKTQVDMYRELTPMRIREYFSSVKAQLEEYNEFLKGQLAEAHREIRDKAGRIDELRMSGDRQSEELRKLQDEKAAIESKARTLDAQAAKLRKKYEGADVVVFKVPRIDVKGLQAIEESSRALRNLMAHSAWTFDVDRLDYLKRDLRLIQEAIPKPAEPPSGKVGSDKSGDASEREEPGA